MMSAAVGLPFILVNVWFGQIWLTFFVSIIGCVGLLELYRLFERLGKYPYKILGLLWTCWFVMNAHFEAIMPIWVLVVGFAILLIFCCLGIFYLRSEIFTTKLDGFKLRKFYTCVF